MKRLLTLFALLAGLTTQAQLPYYVPTEGLVGYWGFNGNANDESGNGNDGTVNGATITEDRFGNPNSAYEFDGEDDFIGVSSLNDFQYNPVSYSFWYVLDTLCTNTAFNTFCAKLAIGRDAIGNTLQGSIGLTNNTEPDYNFNKFAYYTGCCAGLTELTPSLNEWHQLVMVYDANETLNWYHDEELISSESFASGSDANIPFNIGSGGNRWFWDGILDDLGVWDRALTEEEVLALYNGCSVSIETIAGDLTPFTLEENTYNCTNTPNSTYEWEVQGGVITSGQGSSTVTVLWAEEGIGTLTVTETTEEGCEGSVSIEVEIVCTVTATTIEGPLGPGELLEVTYTCDGDASSTYNWSISNGVITSGQGTNTVTVIWASTGLGSITVQETTSADCDGEEITLDVVVVVATGINETLTESINIFPNPVSTNVTISIDESLINASYHLFDARGKLVSEGALTRTNTTLKTTELASGNYVISIGNDQGVVRQQILIEK